MADARSEEVAVLTFHSVSSEPGPTSIPPATFRMQMDILAECGFAAMISRDFVLWHEGRLALPGPRVLLTFDDGYADFATTAHPILHAHGFSGIVFLPTGRLGGREDWAGGNATPRPLLDWPAVIELARSGVEFGGHGVTHADLTRLPVAAAREEIETSARTLAERLGARPHAFAPPYGRVDAGLLADIARSYEVAFGTRFACATRTSPRFDVPRIEMHYFRNARRWRDFLRGGRAYFLARRSLRAVRRAGLAARSLLE